MLYWNPLLYTKQSEDIGDIVFIRKGTVCYQNKRRIALIQPAKKVFWKLYRTLHSGFPDWERNYQSERMQGVYQPLPGYNPFRKETQHVIKD